MSKIGIFEAQIVADQVAVVFAIHAVSKGCIFV